MMFTNPSPKAQPPTNQVIRILTEQVCRVSGREWIVEEYVHNTCFSTSFSYYLLRKLTVPHGHLQYELLTSRMNEMETIEWLCGYLEARRNPIDNSKK